VALLLQSGGPGLGGRRDAARQILRMVSSSPANRARSRIMLRGATIDLLTFVKLPPELVTHRDDATSLSRSSSRW
jgi:hypothetical protein